MLASHAQSYDKGAQIEDPGHVETLVNYKWQARKHRGVNRLGQAAPASLTLLARVAERGENLGTVTAALLRLLDRYGAAELQAATEAALAGGVPHPNAVRLALERRREQRKAPPPVAMILSRHAQRHDKPVQPHRLDSYDKLKGETDEDSRRGCWGAKPNTPSLSKGNRAFSLRLALTACARSKGRAPFRPPRGKNSQHQLPRRRRQVKRAELQDDDLDFHCCKHLDGRADVLGIPA